MGLARWLGAALSALVFGSLPVAADPLDELAALPGMSGRFEQQIIDADGVTVSSSRGSFALRKPSYLRWEIEAPGNQLIISDGATLWQLDRDLDTATRRGIDPAARSPLQLLTASADDLRSSYEVGVAGDTVVLTPRVGDPGFQRLEIVLNEGRIEALKIDDNLGQIITVRLSGQAGEPPLALFTPELPEHLEWRGDEMPLQ